MITVSEALKTYSGSTLNFCYDVMHNSDDPLSTFEYVCKNFKKEPENGTYKVPEVFSSEEKDEYEMIYGLQVDGLIRASIRKCDFGHIEQKDFYQDLWNSYCLNFQQEKQLAFAFYYTIIDKSIPYQYLGKPLSMSNEKFKEITDKYEDVLDKFKYIRISQYAQRTEVASLVLNCIDPIQDPAERAVVLAHAITVFGSRAQKKGIDSDDLEKIKELISARIAALESESDE